MEFFDTVITPQARELTVQCLNSGRVSEGEMTRRFEMEVERQFGMSNCVAVNSGTSALHLALVLAGVKRGDEVILPSQTFVSTGLTILYCGAIPVFADIDMDGNMSFSDMERNATERTKAVILVSWGGNPPDLEKFDVFCGIRKITLIQDNAHSLSSTYRGVPLSYYGDMSCYSFQAIKPLTTGDGGMLTCSEYERARKLRWFGIDRQNDLPDDTGERLYDLSEIGYKYHMNDVSASIGIGNLHGFWDRQLRVEEIANLYNEIEYSVKKRNGCSYWLYDLLVERRSDFMRMMRDKGVPVSAVHRGIDKNTVFSSKAELPNQRYWDENHVCIPIHSSLTDEDIKTVMDSIKGGW